MRDDWHSEWSIVTLNDLGEVNRGRSRVRPRNAPYLYGGQYPFVQTGDITASAGRVSSYTQTYSDAGLAQSRLWPAGTMCITIAANIAETGILQFPACFPDSVVGFIPDKTKADVNFVEYMFRQLKRNIQLEATGSVQDNINLATLARLEFPLPLIGEQRAIAQVLGALDDKIAANTSLAQTMEELLGVEIGQQWLGAQGDVDGADSVSISEFLELNPSLPRPSEPIPVYLDMRKLPETGSGIIDWDHRPAQGGARFAQGDTLLARITPCLQNRKTGFVDFLEPDQVAVGSTEFIVMRSRPHIAKAVSYFVAVSSDFRDFAIRHMVGTSGRQRVSSSDLALFRVRRPNPTWLQEFGARVDEQFVFLKSLRDESRILAATRDALLPQLMSGKLRVKDAERVLEDAGV